MSDDQKTAVARVFGLTAADYGQSGVDFFSLFARRLVDHLQPGSGWHVVDVGSGRGAVAFALPGTQRTLTAIDLAEPMVTALRTDLAERGMTHVTTLVGDLENLDLPDACADPPRRRWSCSFCPICKRGCARLLEFSRPAAPSPSRSSATTTRAGLRCTKAFNPHLPHGHRLENSRPVHPDLADTEGILDALRNAGFEDIRCVMEVHPVHFADVEQLHTWSWSVGLRGPWLQIPEDRRGQVRASILETVAGLASDDGSLTEEFAIRIVTARRQ